MGTFVLFKNTLQAIANKEHDLSNDTINAVPITATPSSTATTPHFGGTGVTNYSTSGTTGGNVPAGGVALTTQTSARSGGVYTFDSDEINVTATAGNPTNVLGFLFYNNTAASKRAIGYYLLDAGVTDMSSSNVTLTPTADGWFQATATP